jgi:hypothetical protein
MLQAGIFYVTLLLVIGTTSLFFAFDCPYMAEITPGAVEYHLNFTSSQFCGSVTFWYGSGSADPYLELTDPAQDPTIYVREFKVVAKKFFLIFFGATYTSFYKDKKSLGRFFLLFLLDYRRIRIRTSYYLFRIRIWI